MTIKEIISNIFRGLNLNVRIDYPRPSTRFIKNKFGDKKLIGLEIGTFEGINAESILKTLDIEKIYLIDPYEKYIDMVNKEENILWEKEVMIKVKDKCMKRLKNYIKDEKVEFIFDSSKNAINNIKDDSLDFVYIDGNHNYEFVIFEMENYWEKLKKGGVLSGHDITHYGVSKSIIEFCSKRNLIPKFEREDWIIEK